MPGNYNAANPYGKAPVLTVSGLFKVYTWIAANAREPLRDAAMVAVSARAGLRAKELAGLDIADVWVRGHLITQVLIRPEITKGAKYGYASFEHDEVIEHVTALVKQRLAQGATHDAPLFLPDRARRYTGDSLRHHLAALFNHGGINGRSHTGRRSFATWLDESGASPRLVQQLMRHASIAMTMEYIDASPSRLRDAVRRI